MQRHFFSFPKKGMFLLALFLTVGFCTFAQQANAPQVIYQSQFDQLSPQKQEYMKSNPQEFVIKADPVAAGGSAQISRETFISPDGQVLPGKAPAIMKDRVAIPHSAPAQPSDMPPSGKMPSVETKKIVISKADWNNMSAERKDYVQAHQELFDIEK